MLTTLRRIIVVGCALLVAAAPASASELRGSPTSMKRQHRKAVEHDYTFMRSAAQVQHLTELGKLERIEESSALALSRVSFPYARAEVGAFVQRLAGEYVRETGTRLVVTSLTRPEAAQPGNAHRLSVHPAGMAVDLRVPADATARAWLESRLLDLETRGVIDATRERHPPHYHVAVFGDAFAAYAKTLDPLPPIADTSTVAAAPVAVQPATEPVQASGADDEGSNDEAAVTLALMMLLVGGTAVRRHARLVVG